MGRSRTGSTEHVCCHWPGPDGIPLRRRRELLALGRSVRGGRGGLAVADRPAAQPRAHPGMHDGHGGAGGTHAAHQVRHQRGVAGAARSRAGGQAVRHHRRAVAGPPAARLRHRQPAGAGMGGAARRHAHARAQDRRGAGDRAPPVAPGQRRLRGRALPPDGRDHLAQAGAGRPADVDRRRVGGGDPAHRARRHRLAGRAGDAGGSCAHRRRHQGRRRRGRTQHRRGPLRRQLPLLFRTVGEPALQRAMEAYTKRTGNDATATSRSAMPASSSSGSPATSPPVSRSSSCAPWARAARRCWPRPAS